MIKAMIKGISSPLSSTFSKETIERERVGRTDGRQGRVSFPAAPLFIVRVDYLASAVTVCRMVGDGMMVE